MIENSLIKKISISDIRDIIFVFTIGLTLLSLLYVCTLYAYFNIPIVSYMSVGEILLLSFSQFFIELVIAVLYYIIVCKILFKTQSILTGTTFLCLLFTILQYCVYYSNISMRVLYKFIIASMFIMGILWAESFFVEKIQKEVKSFKYYLMVFVIALSPILAFQNAYNITRYSPIVIETINSDTQQQQTMGNYIGETNEYIFFYDTITKNAMSYKKDCFKSISYRDNPEKI